MRVGKLLQLIIATTDRSITGLEPVVIQLRNETDGLMTDTDGIESGSSQICRIFICSCCKGKIIELGPENVLCVFTTTSTFAPRTPDDIPSIAKVRPFVCVTVSSVTPRFVNVMMCRI